MRRAMRCAILHILGAASVLLATLGLAMAQSDYPSRLMMKDDLATWVGVVKAANIKPE